MATDLSSLCKGLVAECSMSGGNTISDGTTGAPGSVSPQTANEPVEHIPTVSDGPAGDYTHRVS